MREGVLKLLGSDIARFLAASLGWVGMYGIALMAGFSRVAALSVTAYAFVVMILVAAVMERVMFRDQSRTYRAAARYGKARRILYRAFVTLLIVFGVQVSVRTGRWGVGLACMEMGLLGGTTLVMIAGRAAAGRQHGYHAL
ncbi:MAG: hypothetical protein ACYDH5_14215 [Acidimicrobiales bacterium]